MQKELDWLLTSREQFFDCLEQLDTRGLTDIQRAARFFYTIKTSFGNNHHTYATRSTTIDYAAAYLEKVKERLRGVNIEHKDFSDLIQVYDRKNALFYLDPPYVGTEGYYDGPFKMEDHQRLRGVLGSVEGRFILSYNDCPMIRELYSAYRIEGVSRRSTLAGAGNNSQLFDEVIIRNF